VFGVCCSDSIKIETIKRVELAQQGKGSDAGCRINFETWASARIFELMADNAEQGKIWHLHLDELVTARIEKEQREREAVKKVRLHFTSDLPDCSAVLVTKFACGVWSLTGVRCSAVLLGCSKRLICGKPNSTSSSASCLFVSFRSLLALIWAHCGMWVGCRQDADDQKRRFEEELRRQHQAELERDRERKEAALAEAERQYQAK
jgi:hypothetical protein